MKVTMKSARLILLGRFNQLIDSLKMYEITTHHMSWDFIFGKLHHCQLIMQFIHLVKYLSILRRMQTTHPKYIIRGLLE